jgi:hypothetical protein
LQRYTFAENAAGRPSSYPDHGVEMASGAESLRSYLVMLHEESLTNFSGLDDADLDRRCFTPVGASLPMWKWVRAVVEHEVNHARPTGGRELGSRRAQW